MYDVTMVSPSHLSLQDKEMIKGKLLFFHQNGADNAEIALALRKDFPGISEQVLTNIISSPEYMEAMLSRHKARRMSDESKIWDALVDGAVKGDLKKIELYFKMTGRLKDQIAVSRGKDDPQQNVRDLSDADLEIHFKQATRNLG